MNDKELATILKAAPVPDRTEEYWEDFSRQVLASLRQEDPREIPSRSWQPRLAWGVAAAVACLVIGFAFGHWHSRSENDPFTLLQKKTVLREILAMFPNQVRAIEQDERGMHLILSDSSDVPNSSPIWVEIADGSHRSAFVTFSGQEIQAGAEKLTVLSESGGSVIVMGETFAWSSRGPALASTGLKIQTRQLTLSSM